MGRAGGMVGGMGWGWQWKARARARCVCVGGGGVPHVTCTPETFLGRSGVNDQASANLLTKTNSGILPTFNSTTCDNNSFRVRVRVGEHRGFNYINIL